MSLLVTHLCKFSASPCDRNAKCVNTEGSFTCKCKQDFAGDGFKCKSTLVDEESFQSTVSHWLTEWSLLISGDFNAMIALQSVEVFLKTVISVKLAVITAIMFVPTRNMVSTVLVMKVSNSLAPNQKVANVKMSMNVMLERLFVAKTNFAQTWLVLMNVFVRTDLRKMLSNR